MNKNLLRSLVFTIGGALILIVAASAFNILTLSNTAGLARLISFSDAFFFEGLLFLAIGIMILLRLPHGEALGGRRKIIAGSGLTKDDGVERNTALNTLALGLAFIIGAIAMFVLYFWELSTVG